MELTERGAIAIDDCMRTNVPHIYAIGDCTAKLMLAHVAEAQGIVAAETIAGAETMPIDYVMVPRATYCQPQIGSFGYTEAQAKEQGVRRQDREVPVHAPTARRTAWGRRPASSSSSPTRSTARSSGLHMVGPDVTELLPELTLAQQWDLTAEEVARNIHAHPTLSEALKEVAHGIPGHMINM